MARKSIVVIMNCQGHELIRYLRSSFSLSCQYSLTYVSSILQADDERAKAQVLSLLAAAHVVIAQDASSVPWLRNDAIAQVVPRGCRFFRLCFWRFYGYWPMPAQRFHPQMWYVCDEVAPAATVRDYLRTDVRPALINLNFEEQIEKFALIERKSELRMLPFFLDHCSKVKLFTDEWHPTSIFFLPVARYVLSELSLPDDIVLLSDDGQDNFRHRLVFDAVTEELGLSYDQNLLKYHQTETDRETFFEYCQFARHNYDRVTPWLNPNGSFREWCYVKGIDDTPCEVSALGQTDRISTFRCGGDTPTHPSPARIRSPRPAAVPAVLWSIDLRAHREVRSIDLRFMNTGPEMDASVAVLSSTDGHTWRKLTVINDRIGIGASYPLSLAFSEPVLCRHIRVEILEPACIDLEDAKVYTRVVSLAQHN